MRAETTGMGQTLFLPGQEPRPPAVMARRPYSGLLLPLWSLAVLAAAAGPVAAQRLPTETSLHFWRLHQPDSPFHDPDWMWERDDRETGGRYGTRNAREAYSLVSSPEEDAEMEPQRLERKLMLAAPLVGRGNVLPLLLEPSANLAVVLAERMVLGKGGSRIEAPPGFVAIDTHVHTCYSPDSVADPTRVLRTAARRGLAGIAVTDHDLRLGLRIAAHPLLPSGVGRLIAALPFDAVETLNMAEEIHFSLASGQENRKRVSFYAGVRGARLGVSDAHDPSVVGLGYTLVPGPTVDEATLRRALVNGETQVCRMATEERLQRLVGRLPRLAIPGLRALRRGLGWGGRVLKGITGADRAELRPRFDRGGFGWSLSLTKRF